MLRIKSANVSARSAECGIYLTSCQDVRNEKDELVVLSSANAEGKVWGDYRFNPYYLQSTSKVFARTGLLKGTSDEFVRFELYDLCSEHEACDLEIRNGAIVSISEKKGGGQ